MSLAVHPMSTASPDLTDDTMAALRESIATLGQLVPIVMWRGEVIDGRKRLACCEALGLEPIIVAVADDANAADHAGALNLLRTHYTPSQLAMYASHLATVTSADGPRIRDQRSKANLPEMPRGLTRAEAGAVVGVSDGAIRDAKRVRRDGAPELIEAVERGDLTLHAAKKIIDRVPLHEQSAIAARVCTEKVGRKNMPARVLGLEKPRASKPKPVADILSRLFIQVEDCTRILADHLDAPLPDAATREDWLASLDRILPPLRRMRRRLHEEG